MVVVISLGEPTGFFKMRFIGKPDGKLMKGAPGNFKQGEEVFQPYRLSNFPFWELLEDKPVLKIPPPSKSDSVFEESVYIPDDDNEAIDEVDISPSTLIESVETEVIGNEPLDEDTSRKELKKRLADAGVEFNVRARTSTLQKLVDELDAKE